MAESGKSALKQKLITDMKERTLNVIVIAAPLASLEEEYTLKKLKSMLLLGGFLSQIDSEICKTQTVDQVCYLLTESVSHVK